MATPILATKLFVPVPRPNAVHRGRLFDLLNANLGGDGQFVRKLTLISAPAGFGKTSLVAEWVRGIERPVAWLSVGEEDSNPIRFLTYVVAAVRTILPEFGEGVWSALHGTPPPPLDGILAALLNQLAMLSGSFVLVLDDYHVVDAESVDQAMAFLLEHLPPMMHVVITTREDPLLPLPRMRVRSQLTEVRAADLRFTQDEAAGFFNQVMALNLASEEIDALEHRTEGWIAGLQLAALSMQGREDVHDFVRAFAGDDRYIVDYLVEEVLQRQSGPVRNFLLQTSILDRLNGALCDAVTGQREGRALLEALERGNLFVVSLDDKRRWYRYHHLFADMLQAHLMEEQPDQVSILHQRASEWYAQHGRPAEAIRHAFAAKDFALAAMLIELAWREMDRSLESVTWLEWVKALPDELVRARPILSLGYAWALLSGGALEEGAARLRDAERWIDTSNEAANRNNASSMVVVDHDAFRLLAASVAAARAFHAQALGDAAASMQYAQRALDLYPAEEYAGRAVPAAIVGLTSWALGDLDAAYRMLSESMAGFRRTGNTVAALSVTYPLADIRVAQGRLLEAIRTYHEMLQLALAQGQPVPRGTADLYLGLADLACEQGDLEKARHYLAQGEALGEQAALQDWPHRVRVVQARIRQAEGDLAGALDLLDEAERRYYRSPVPDIRPIPALKVPIWLAQGEMEAALDWAKGFAVDDELCFLNEFEHITLARVRMAQHAREQADAPLSEALRLLVRLLETAEAGGRMGRMIEVLVLQAVAQNMYGDSSAALHSLERALALAEPEGYVRVFVNEGPAVAALLRKIAQQGAAYARHLLNRWEMSHPPVPVSHDLVEPLSERELDVLRLLRTDMTGPEIARELMVSLNTMRTHTKNIYAKLGVNSRQTAVERAAGLGLL